MKQQLLNHITTSFPNTYELQKQYRSHPDYSLLTIDNFIPKDLVTLMAKELDDLPLEECKHFTRAGSCMYEFNNVDRTPVQDAVVHALHSSTFIKWLQEVTDTVDLIPDPHLVGAGYMKSFTGDSLKVHTDFNWNDQLRLHRMLSVVIYLNEEWYPNWGGLFLYKREEDPQINTFFPSYNCCVINNNQILHGTSAVTSEAQDRETVQVFWYERKDVK